MYANYASVTVLPHFTYSVCGFLKSGTRIAMIAYSLPMEFL